MGKQCIICGFRTIFFKWSTFKGFPRKELISRLYGISDYEKSRLSTGRVGVPVCNKCVKKLEKEKLE